MNKDIIVEICCGSYYDAKQASLGGAERIELNSALYLGGLTPTVSVLKLVKAETKLKVICMVRPRGGGFCYTEEDFLTMQQECRELMEAGADGIAFGCLNHEMLPDIEKNGALINIIKAYGGEVVFHRAFDCVSDPYSAAEQLIGLGVDRILTSGLKPKALEGAECIRQLQKRYGMRIEILAGSGVNAGNAKILTERTGIRQVHSSCKGWKPDPSTRTGDVSYSYAEAPHELDYEVVSRELVEELVKSIE